MKVVEVLAPKTVYLYEAHRPWRDLFHLPFIDLNAYARELSQRFPQMTFQILTRAGQVLISDETAERVEGLKPE